MSLRPSTSTKLSLSTSTNVPAGAPPESAVLVPEDDAMLRRLEVEFAADMPIDPVMMIRFVRGYKKEKTRWETTVLKLREALKWRKSTGADSILLTPLEGEEEFFDMWPHDFHGFSKCGHPVYYESSCATDPNTLITRFPIEEQQTFQVQVLEMNEAIKRHRTRETGLRTYKTIIVMDLGGLSRHHMSSKFTGPIQAQINIAQYYYPESLQTMFIINSPFIFRMLWGMIKPWLHPITAQRIQILGSDYLVKLKNVIDESQIPQYHGGSCTCCEKGKTLKEQSNRKYKLFVEKRAHIIAAEADARSRSPTRSALKAVNEGKEEGKASE